MNVDREVLKIALRGKSGEVMYGYIESIETDARHSVMNPKTRITFVTYQEIYPDFTMDFDVIGKMSSFAIVKVPHDS